MANKFKYNKTGAEANSIFKGNWAIDNTPINVGGGPSSSTGFYNGANIPAGGYAIYSPTSVFVAANDAQLLAKVSQFGGETGSVNGALSWLAGQSAYVVLNKNFENIATNGLVLNVDASNISSYVDAEPTINLLYGAGTVNFTNGAGDIYGNSTKTDLGGGKFRFVNNRAGSTTIRLYTNQASLINGATYACSVYFENLFGSISFDWCDTSITGTNSSTAASGRLAGYGSRATYDGPYYFLDIDLSIGGAVTLFNPQVEQKSFVTAFVSGTRTQNSTFYDLSGNNKHGTLTNGPTFNSNGYIVFDGNDDYISILNPLNQSNLSQVWSVTALVKLNSGTSGPQYIIGPNGLNSGVAADWYNNGPLLYLNGGANDYYTYGNYVYIGGTGWKHLTYLFNNSTGLRQIYKNGILIGNSAGPNNTSTPSGQGATWTLGQMAGSISSIQVYNRVISTTEIYQNYYKGPAVTSGLIFAVDAGNLVSYESGSTTTYNLAGSETSTLVNGVGYNTGNGGSWTFDGANDYIELTPSIIPTGTEISISFWNYGISAPSSSIIAASFNNSDQTLNVHLPWSNNGIYWDCGYPFNRIDKIATNAEYQGWHNWVFTKNAATGNMSIYLDGALWHSGSGNTSAIPVMTVARMGSYWNSQLYHIGRIAQCLIHNRALTADEVTQNFSAQRNRFGI